MEQTEIASEIKPRRPHMERSKSRPDAAEFFLVTLPGLEDLVAAEVSDWFPDLKTHIEYGGVTVIAPLERGLEMNIALKTPTRILVRVYSFVARDFPKLFQKMSEFPWQKWVSPHCEIEVHESTKRSRLKIKKRIVATCEAAWREQQRDRRTPSKKPSKIRLYVRILDDVCTVSLDTSGERLHKRGARELIGEAPLRETIAASLFQSVARGLESSNLPVEVVDPMMGSGVFLLEAATREKLVEAREFPFDAFARAPSGSPSIQKKGPNVTGLIGFEQDQKTIAAAKANFKAANLEHQVDVRVGDFFKAEPLPAPPGQRWVFCNPPYGERLAVEESLREFYENLFAATERVARPDRACFLLPAKVVHGKFVLPYQWTVLEKRRFLNGGIPVVAFVFGRQT